MNRIPQTGNEFYYYLQQKGKNEDITEKENKLLNKFKARIADSKQSNSIYKSEIKIIQLLNYFKKNESGAAIDLLKKIPVSILVKDIELINVLFARAHIYFIDFQTEFALECFKVVAKCYSVVKNYLNTAIAFSYIGYDFYRIAQLEKAKKCFISALEYLKNCNEDENVILWKGQVFGNLGAVFRIQKKFVSSKLFAYEGIRLRQHFVNKKDAFRDQLGIANTYRDEGNIDYALELYSSVLEKIKKISVNEIPIADDFILRSRALNGRIFCQIKKNNNLKPIEYYLLEDKRLFQSNNIRVNEFEEELESMIFALKSEGKLESIEILENYLLLSELKQMKGEWPKANEHYLETIRLSENKNNNIFKLNAKQRYLANTYYSQKSIRDLNNKVFINELTKLEAELDKYKQKTEYIEIIAKQKWLLGNYHFSELLNTYSKEKHNKIKLENLDQIADEFFAKAFSNYLEGYKIFYSLFHYVSSIFPSLIHNRLTWLLKINSNLRSRVISLIAESKVIKNFDFFEKMISTSN